MASESHELCGFPPVGFIVQFSLVLRIQDGPILIIRHSASFSGVAFSIDDARIASGYSD